MEWGRRRVSKECSKSWGSNGLFNCLLARPFFKPHTRASPIKVKVLVYTLLLYTTNVVWLFTIEMRDTAREIPVRWEMEWVRLGG